MDTANCSSRAKPAAAARESKRSNGKYSCLAVPVSPLDSRFQVVARQLSWHLRCTRMRPTAKETSMSIKKSVPPDSFATIRHDVMVACSGGHFAGTAATSKGRSLPPVTLREWLGWRLFGRDYVGRYPGD